MWFHTSLFFDCVQRVVCSIKPSNNLNRKVFNLKTLSRTHGVVEVGLLEVILSNIPSPLKQCHPEPVTCTAFKYLQGWRLQNLFWAACASTWRLSHNKEMFPGVLRESPVFQLVAIDPYVVTEHQWKQPGSVFLDSPIRYLYALVPLFARMNNPYSLKVSW